MEFTKETIAALTLPVGKFDLIHFDDDLPGFGIRLRAAGKRVWIVQYRASGPPTAGDARRRTHDRSKGRQGSCTEALRRGDARRGAKIGPS